jgi:hypothetical protein
MRGFRLNGWQRIGIVLSILWALGAGLYTYKAHEARADKMSGRDYDACINAKETLSKLPETKGINFVGDCVAEAAQSYQFWSQWKWSGTAIVALIPIPIIWLLVYIVVWATRWRRTNAR